MSAMWFAVAALGLLDGWLADNPALIIAGFLCALMGFASLLRRDVRTNHDVIYDQHRARAEAIARDRGWLTDNGWIWDETP